MPQPGLAKHILPSRILGSNPQGRTCEQEQNLQVRMNKHIIVVEVLNVDGKVWFNIGV